MTLVKFGFIGSGHKKHEMITKSKKQEYKLKLKSVSLKCLCRLIYYITRGALWQ